MRKVLNVTLDEVCDFKQSNGGRLVVCTRTITLDDCATLNRAKGEDW